MAFREYALSRPVHCGSYKRQLILKFEIWDCGCEAAEGGTMTFWLTTKILTELDPQGAGCVGDREFCDVSVSERVSCGVGEVVALRSFSRS